MTLGFFCFKKKNWSIVYFQCCIISGIQQSDADIYIYIHTHTYTLLKIFFQYTHSFKNSFIVCFITGYWMWFPMLHNRTLLFIHSMYNSLYLLTPNSQSSPPPPPSPLAATSVSFMSVSLLLFSRWVHLCHVLDSTYKWYHMVLSSSFWLSMVISKSINVSANDISKFFFMSWVVFHYRYVPHFL